MAGSSGCIPVIGLIGGIGSGKSHLARQLALRRRVVVVNADQIGHEILMQLQVRSEIRREFGDTVFAADGEVDRRRLGARVFGPESSESRKKLDAIMHPRIAAVMEQEIAQARKTPGVELVVVDAALLLEAGWRTQCDLVVFVNCAFEERLSRVASTRGWSADELRRREASQWPLERKRAEADAEVDNSSTGRAVEELEQLLNVRLTRVSAG
ncbi:MAG: dephospho-CoA kinase [Planctomycetaceae bacterium]|nr:MAG: dephospho-CoA kinase [Planctomycetaceae bacterium]